MLRSATISGMMLVMLAVGAGTAPASAAEVCDLDPNGDYYLSVREGPGSRYPELTRLGQRTYVDIIDSNDDGSWYLVEADGEPTGWVYAGYICQ
ncbi:SH3 domain-containing protein [Aurantimonas sp. DM33-3]|uniref:SH3 domain-containing protein n=1 Tax=Aurantimonas sp. DM33-3 TaxID=2766955 RepID=UPI0016528B5C|nr:SH3 domain-containing protein [Aurantimonas sp. DM33-3]MBC6716045.1 SH3 domain-containing protein [Aurantimonas sp. DM33-3]